MYSGNRSSRLFWRITAIVTILSFLPASVEAQHFLPSAPPVETNSQVPLLSPMQLAQLDEAPNGPAPLTQLALLDGEKTAKLSNPDAVTSPRPQAETSLPIHIARLSGEQARSAGDIYEPAVATEEAPAVVADPFADYENRPAQYTLPQLDIVFIMGEAASLRAAKDQKREQLAQGYVVRRERTQKPSARVVRGGTALQEPEEPVSAATSASVAQGTAGASLSASLGITLEGMPAEEMLALGDQLYSEGRPVDSALVYFAIQDFHPYTPSALLADESLVALAKNAETGRIPAAQVDEFLSLLPPADAWDTASGLYWASVAWRIGGRSAAAAGNQESARERFVESARIARAVLEQYPTDPVVLLSTREYLYAARAAGQEAVTEAKQYLDTLAENGETSQELRWAIASEMAVHDWKFEHNRTDGMLGMANVADEYERGELSRMTDNGEIPGVLRASWQFSLGYAYYQLNSRDKAVGVFEDILEQHGDIGSVTDWARYYLAHTTYLRDHQDPIVGIEAFNAALAAKPDSTVADLTVYMLGTIYLKAGDFDQATAMFSENRATFPDSEFFETALGALADVEEARAAAAALAAEQQGVGAQAGLEGDLLCGPFALAKLMEAQGLDADFPALAERFGSGTRLVSLAELTGVASEHGVMLTPGEFAVEEAALPFIAHVAPDHFVAVVARDARSVSFREAGKPLQIMAIDRFKEQFSGMGLQFAEHAQVARALTQAEAQEVLGGMGGGSGSHLTETSDVTINCPNNDNCKECDECCPPSNGGSGAGGGGGGGGGGSGKVPTAGGGSTCMALTPACKGGDPEEPGAPGSEPGDPCGGSSGPPPPGQHDGNRPLSMNPNESIAIATGAPGSTGSYNPRQGTQIFGSTDISFSVQGSQTIQFSRTWSNPWGFIPGYTNSTTRPFRNNIGAGGTHNYSTHLRLSNVSGYLVHVDNSGNTSLFYNSSDDANYEYYTYSGGKKPGFIHARIKQSKTTDEFYFERPGEVVSQFSEPLGTDNYCRLMTLTDVGGNAITLEYDDSKRTPYGILTKVEAPGSDDRYLNLLYDTDDELITRVRFVAGSTEVKFIHYSYEYERLTEVVHGSGSNYGDPVNFEYATPTYAHGGIDYYPIYISRVIDRAGEYTDFEMRHEYRSPNGFMVQRARIMYASGLDVVAEKTNLSSSIYNLEVTSRDGADFDTGTDEYTTNPYTKWTSTANTGDTDSSRPAWFRFFTDPLSGSGTYKEWSYNYDSDGRLVSIITPNSKTWESRSYTGTDQTNVATHFGTTIGDNEYAASGDVFPSTLTGSDGTKTYYYYDAHWRITRKAHPSSSASDPPGGSDGIKYEYNGINQITKITAPDGRSMRYDYDTRGNLIELILPGDNPTTPTHALEYWYNDYGVVTKTKNALGKFTEYTYSDEGCSSCGGSAGLKLIGVEDHDSNITAFEYDENGNQIKVTDALSRETIMEYDTMNRLIRMEDPDGRESTMTYDILGRLIAQTGPDGKTTEYEHDYMGRVTKVTNVDVRPGHDIDTLYAYDDISNLTKVTDGNGHETVYHYSATTNLLSKTVDADGNEVYYLYDSSRRMTKTALNSAGTTEPTSYEYKATTGQLTKVNYPNGGGTQSVTYNYDTYGRLDNLVDWMNLGVSTGHEYDYEPTTGRMTKYTDFDGEELAYEYNVGGQVTKMTDYDGNVTTHTYTNTGQLSTLTAPGSKTWTFTYNALGQRTQVVYPNSMKAIYAYDTSNRMTKLEYTDGAGSPTTLNGWQYGLAADGNILRMASLTSQQRWDYGYDGRGRLTSAIRADNSGVPQFREAYTYDDGDNMLTKATVPYTPVITDTFADGNYTANPAWTVSGNWTVQNTGESGDNYIVNSDAAGGHLYMTQTAGDTDTWFSYKQTTAGTLIAHARFTNWDNRIRVNFGTASAVLYQNDAAVQTVLDSNASAGSDLNQWYDIYFRCEGSRIEVWRGKRGEPLERILFSDAATETASGQLRFTIPASTNYRIDNIQVMKPDAPNVVTTTSVYNDANELTSTTTGGVTTAYTYDGWGRTISKTDGTHDAAYTWRFGDKLRVYTSDFPGEADVAYNYDGLGNRRNRLNNPNGAYTDADLTWYRWGTEWNLIGEYESDDYATWDVGDLKHWYLGKAAQVNGSSPAIGDYRYYTTDHLGSPRAVYSQAQAVIATQEFTPFGSYHTTSGIDQTIGFTGHQWDDSTQAVYAPFRNYGPDAARWLSRDPLGMVDGENLYVYVMNNASNLIDELGLFSSLQGCAQMPGVCGGVLAPKPPPSLLPPLFLWPFVPGDKQPDPKPKKPECEYGDDPCEKQYDKEVALCGLVPRHRREACYRQAGQRFSECTTFGAPRSPFPYP